MEPFLFAESYFWGIGLAEAEGDEIPAVQLMLRRRLLGYLVPGFNMPLFGWNLYQMVIRVQTEAINVNSMEFLEEFLITFSALFLSIVMPRFFPVYQSKYRLESEGVSITRFLRGRKVLPYGEIDRAEVYLRLDEKISEEAKKYAMDASAGYRKSGFKFKDYTNAEDKIMNLFVGLDIYMISPEKPKALLKELKRRNRKFSAKLVELTSRGKRIQELG
jgi:hypothetical protein